MKLVNPFMRWLLHSPFHHLISKRYMLVTVKGRKSGHLYTTPVEYGVDGESIVVVSSQYHTWWKNLRDGATCRVLKQGQALTGTTKIADDTQAIAVAFRIIYPKMTPDQITRLTPGRVAIWITP
jgi:deazaflavin-dependent oxidoreductase (nitroreductase family)